MKPSWTEIAALALLLGFGAVLAKGWPTGGDFWIALGAIGSLSAALVALWFGTSETRQRLTLERLEAKMLATSLKVPLVNASRAIRSASDVISDLDPDDLATRYHKKEVIQRLAVDLDRAQELMSSACDQLPVDEIHKLVHMPGNAALRLSAIISELRSIVSGMQRQKKGYAILIAEGRLEDCSLPHLQVRCSSARKGLLELARECSKYART